ncbi:MAG: branched-chain amino acid ABC transporter permease [Thermoproteota archaeon]
MQFIIQAIVNGILLGGLYGLFAIGLTLPFGVMDIPNFAHGEFIMLSMFASYWLWALYGIDPMIYLVIAIPLFFAIGVLIERVILRRLFNIRAPTPSVLLCLAGLSMFLMSFALFNWGVTWYTLNVSYREVTIRMGDIIIGMPNLLSFIGAVVLSLSVMVFLNKTFIGKALRATFQNRDAATLMGIDYRRMYSICFGLGVALAGAAGPFLATFYVVFPTVGGPFTMIAFVVVVLGTLGDPRGAFLGGMIIGIVESVITQVSSSDIAWIAIFVIFVLLLMFKPEGLFGKRVAGVVR